MSLPPADEVASRVAAIRARVAQGSLEVLGSSGEDPVLVAPPDPAWPARFRSARERIAVALGNAAMRIDHVGSTSIPGIAAKPILDIQVSVVDLTDESRYAAQLATLGWPMRLREPDQRFFREPAGQQRTTHVHVCQTRGNWERSHLLFRDYLRAHSDRAAAYGDLKWALAEQYREDRLAYTEAKGPFIDETMALAERWATETGWRP